MAETAKPLTVGKSTGRRAPVVPMELPTRRRFGVLAPAKDLAAAAYQGTRTGAVRSYSFALEKTASLWTGVRDRFARAREEKPLQLVMLMGGMAFMLGIALRVWRSKRDA